MICSPGGIRGERTSATTALLTWDEPYTRCVYCPYNASGYEVMAEGIATITVSRPPCVINGLNPNQEYFFYLYAKAAGNIRSNPSRARIGRYVPDRTPPSKPTELRTESVVGNRVDLAWVASVDNGGVVGYQIFCDGKLIGNTDSTRYAVADLNDATTYIFMVRAQDPDGNHADSDPLMVSIPDLGGPTIPGNFRVIAAITRDTISVGWFTSYSQPFQGLLTLAALSTRSVDTWAFAALPSSHSFGLGTFGPRLLLTTALGWMFRASASRY